MDVSRKSKQEIEEEERKIREKAENNPLFKLMGGYEEEEKKRAEQAEKDKIAGGFVRSMRNQ